MEFLRQKSERDYQFRQEELRIKQKEQENLQNIQQQQLEMMRMMHQQSNAMMLLMSKIVKKKPEDIPCIYVQLVKLYSFIWAVQLRL